MRRVSWRSVAVLSAILSSLSEAQPSGWKEDAQKAIESGTYRDAISLLRRVVDQSPAAAEAYYFLGFATHYLSYDSLPMSNAAIEKNSDDALEYLRRAASLDPLLGDAFYLIGAEYGARFLRRMRTGDLEGMRTELRRADTDGALPAWLVEYNWNMLKSCAENAILFTSGDALAYPSWYLQYVKGVRSDVTVVPLALLGQSWYLLMMLDGTEVIPSPLTIGWDETQALSTGPYKWKTNTVEIELTDEVCEHYGVEQLGPLRWIVEPDFSRLGSEKTYLTKGVAALIDVLQANKWQRPVHFAFGIEPEGLRPYLQMRGLTYKLLPVQVGGSVPALDIEVTEALILDDANFRQLPTLTAKSYRRIGSLPINYRAVFVALLEHYYNTGQLKKAEPLITQLRETLPERILPMEPGMVKWLELIETELAATK